MALLHLAVQAGLEVQVATVNHGLRSEAAAEAAMVAEVCAGLGVRHTTLHWQGWDGKGNLMDQARRARFALLSDWARAEDITMIALGHTRDDIAETFLMRLARGAGVDGLAAMAARRDHLGIIWLRPLLECGRQELRDWLTGQGINWVDDPSNEDPRFGRVRMRKAMKALAALGIEADTLAQVAGQLADVREALTVQTREAAHAHARAEAGDVVFDPATLEALPSEIVRRLVAAALKWVASAEYGPRGADLARVIARMRDGQTSTLMGCRILPWKGGWRILREWQAVRTTLAAPGTPWDGRWRLSGPENNGLEIRSLGEAGLILCPGWRETGLPRATLLASPAVWRGDTLVAAPLAGMAHGWLAEAGCDKDAFFLSALSH